MKKIILFAFLATAMFSLGMTSAEAVPAKKKAAARADKFEPNNTKETASDISNLIGNQHTEYEKWYGIDLSASIGLKTDYDWYKIKLDPNKNYYICSIIEGSTSLGEYGFLMSSYADNDTLEEEFMTTYGTASSEHWQRIYHKNYLYLNILPYQLNLNSYDYPKVNKAYEYDLIVKIYSFDDQPVDRYEPNDSLEIATVIPYSNNIEINGTIHKFDDIDFYRIYFPPSHNYKIHIDEIMDWKYDIASTVEFGVLQHDAINGSSIYPNDPDNTDNTYYSLDKGGWFYLCVHNVYNYIYGLYPYKIKITSYY